jgi:6-phosphogluconate dehydrogenase
MKDERIAASKILPAPEVESFSGDREQFINAVQTRSMPRRSFPTHRAWTSLRAASDENEWDLGLGAIAAIWRGGCIIRAKFLDRITEAYGRDSKLSNLMLDPFFTEADDALRSRLAPCGFRSGDAWSGDSGV